MATDVVTFLSQQLKRSRGEVTQYATCMVPPSEENKLLFHELLTKYAHDESIQLQVLSNMKQDEDGAYIVSSPLIEKLLVFLLKKERQEKDDKLTFESFRVKDAENQNVLLREQMTVQSERIEFLEKRVETTDKLRADLETANRNLFSVIRERDEAQKRATFIAEDLKKSHEKKRTQEREKANTDIIYCEESFKRLVDEVCTPDVSIEHKRRMAEIIDRLRLCVAINF